MCAGKAEQAYRPPVAAAAPGCVQDEPSQGVVAGGLGQRAAAGGRRRSG